MTEEDKKFEKLICNCCEEDYIDYKEGYKWASYKSRDCEIIKDIIAMANIKGGGNIIFGVKDCDYTHVGLSDEDYASFDQTKINELLENYVVGAFFCKVKKKNYKNKKFVWIMVPEFSDYPIICKNDYTNNKTNKKILEKAAIYVRTEKATSEKVKSINEITNIINLAVEKKINAANIDLKDVKQIKNAGQLSDKVEAVETESITAVKLGEKVYSGVVCKKCGTHIGLLVGSDSCPTCGSKLYS